MIKPSIEKSINNQINAEEYSARMYMSMASWCEVKGLPGFAKFLYHHANEEMQHMMRFVKYLNGKGGHALIDAVEKPTQDFKDIQEVFEIIYKHECDVTKMIHDMYEFATTEKDYATCNMLQWFIAEQIEEEEIFSTALDMIKAAGKTNIFFVDMEMGKKAE